MNHKQRQNVMKPEQSIINKAVEQVRSQFTKEIFECTKLNSKSFVVSVVNIRSGFQFLIDYTFNSKNGKLINSKTIEKNIL